MLGAIAGDIIGSIFEHKPIKTTDFSLFDYYSRFTDDTVLTVAIANSILEKISYKESLKYFAREHPDAGYGQSFYYWMASFKSEPYNSWGNGSAMRVSPIGFAFNSIEDVLNEAEKSAVVTHSHPEGIIGSQATALAIFLARTGSNKEKIKKEISERFHYDLDRTICEIRPFYHFDVSCQGTVPEAIISFLESKDYENAIRIAISLGGDSDTLACIKGGIAQAFFKKIPKFIVTEVYKRLPSTFVSIIERFNTCCGLHFY